MPQMVACATLVNRLAEQVAERRAAHGGAIRMAAMVFITALTAAAAQISIPLPFTQVPFTFQPMVVLLGGLVLGSRLALGSQVLYLMAGIAGLPVFASSVTLPPGALRLLGPTGGYLMAFPLAAFATGWLAERGFDRHYGTSILAMAAGLSIIFLGGVAWLANGVGLTAALATGLYPFIIVDVIKIVAAGLVLPSAWALLGREK